MPGLAVALSLQMSSYPRVGISHTSSDDVVSFISSLLLGSDQAVRNWFAQFVKAAQKVSDDEKKEKGGGDDDEEESIGRRRTVIIIIMEISTVPYLSKKLTAQGVY